MDRVFSRCRLCFNSSVDGLEPSMLRQSGVALLGELAGENFCPSHWQVPAVHSPDQWHKHSSIRATSVLLVPLSFPGLGSKAFFPLTLKDRCHILK